MHGEWYNIPDDVSETIMSDRESRGSTHNSGRYHDNALS